MPCETVRDGDHVIIICSRGERRWCYKCGRISVAQCDFPVVRYKSGKKKGQWRTCDRHLCRDHRNPGVTPNVDFCPEHYPVAKAAHERRQAKVEV